MNKCLMVLMSVSLSISASAKALYAVQNGDTITANISATDLTRIEIAGQKIIKDFSAANISRRITKPLGQVYLIPNASSTFNLYIVSDTGNTYNLKLTPIKNMVGDSIIIMPDTPKVVHKDEMTTSAYIRNINYLIQTMYLNKDNQYDVADLNQAISTYADLDSVILRKYANGNLTGYVLLLKNTAKTPILLTEAEFYAPHTLAVAIEHPNLQVNDFTRVFLVKEVE